MNIKRALTRKLGPIPAWGWLTGLAGALVLWRHLHPSSSATTASTTSTATTPDLTSTGDSTLTGFPTGGGGGGGLDSTPQDTADPGLAGAGTPTVYDPTTGAETDLQTELAAMAAGFGQDNPGGLNQPADGDTSTIGSGGRTGATKPKPKPKKAAVAPQSTVPARPATSKGQKKPKLKPAPELVSENGNPHPQSVGKAPPAPARRAQVLQPATIARPRSTSVVQANAGARPVVSQAAAVARLAPAPAPVSALAARAAAPTTEAPASGPRRPGAQL